MLPRSDIEAIDRSTVLYILYSTISVQQTNVLPENQKVDMAYTTSECLSSYGCTIIVLYCIYNIVAGVRSEGLVLPSRNLSATPQLQPKPQVARINMNPLYMKFLTIT